MHVTDSAEEFQMANFILLGVVMPYKLPTATNRTAVNCDVCVDVTGQIAGFH